MLDEYTPTYFPSSDDEYELCTKPLHDVYPINELNVDPVIYTLDAVAAVHELNVRDEKERVFVEM